MEYIDLRSDTVTWPTYEMRLKMSQAEVGDDGYQDDILTIELESRMAQLLGKEAALFVPTGVMGNQISVFYHSSKYPKGSEILLSEECHILCEEAGAAPFISGVVIKPVKPKNGILEANTVEKHIKQSDCAFDQVTSMIEMENPTRTGIVWTPSQMESIYTLAQSRGIGVHLDGARIFNAAAHLKVQPTELTRYCDTIMTCLSKGLGAPIGSVVAGTRDFIKFARKARKILGGEMRQVGILAAACIYSIDNILPQLEQDNYAAKQLAEELSKIKSINVLKERTQINMVFFFIPCIDFKDTGLLRDFLYKKKIIISTPFDPNFPYRMMTHHYIREKEIQIIVECMREYLESINV